MALVTYATYIPEIRPFVPGCPDPTILNALQRTANIFFWKTQSYRIWLPVFDLTISTTTYTLGGLPAQTETAQIMQLFCSGVAVDEKAHSEFLALDPQWPTKTGTQAQYYTVLNDTSTFNIIPIPSATVTGAFNAQVALSPTLTATGLEQAHFESWKDGLIDGALSRLMEMPNQVWSNAKDAVERHTRYNSQAMQAKAQANMGNVRRDLNVQMRPWV